ncbi:hypothetical protein IC582_016399 [Cucumis melo]
MRELRLAACFLVDWITCELSLGRMLSMLSWMDWIGWIGLVGSDWMEVVIVAGTKYA